jgi:hypothetical protein
MPYQWRTLLMDAASAFAELNGEGDLTCSVADFVNANGRRANLARFAREEAVDEGAGPHLTGLPSGLETWLCHLMERTHAFCRNIQYIEREIAL